MRAKYNVLLLTLVAALVAVGYGVYRTGRKSAATLPAPAPRRASAAQGVVVDQSSLDAAVRLVRQPTSADERSYAQDALRLADQEMDLAFAQAVRSTLNRPPASTPEAKESNERLQQALHALATDSAQVTELAAAATKANVATAQGIDDRLNLARAQVALDHDQVDDARADLIRAGGDPQGRMQAMIAEHDEASRSSDSVRVNLTPLVVDRGLIGDVQALQALYQKEAQIADARAQADSLATAFKQRHDRLEARAAARRNDGATSVSHDSSTALLAATQQSARNEKSRATLDQRVDNQHRLSDVYTGWIGVVSAHESAVINRALEGIGAILIIVIVALVFARWAEHSLGGRALDRRRTQTLYMVTRVSLQVLAVLLILLVVFGRPDNLGTFLGLAGAGLTVALKDFIVAFVGWFVLMGKNGIRIGDLVEINDVTGEVVDLGLFYTVLLETGNWTESGHPTGRRVSFTNGFAVEGHYFNFSTSGQWLWDEVRLVVPAGHDPYPVVEAMQREAEEATADTAQQAQEQWRGARNTPHLGTEATAPSVTLKPIGEGVEVTVRFVTRVTERAALRSRLYHTAVDLIGGTAPGVRTPGAPTPAVVTTR